MPGTDTTAESVLAEAHVDQTPAIEKAKQKGGDNSPCGAWRIDSTTHGAGPIRCDLLRKARSKAHSPIGPLRVLSQLAFTVATV
ncbi:hypothetical protein OKW42_001394 [Paraburkholderia sp. WC7.3d]